MAKGGSDAGREASARVMLYETIARLREESGKSLAELQELTTYDRAYLHKLETGARLGSPQVVAALDAVYGTKRQLSQLWVLAREDAFGDRYQRFMRLEREATVQYKYVCSVVPGLLQTEAYAEEILAKGRPRDDGELAEQVTARMSRQDILEGDDAPHFRALLDEAVFRRAATDPKVWRDQLEALLEAGQRSGVTIQVVPFSAGLHDLLGGSLTVLWLANGKSVAYLESSKSGELIEEPEKVEALRLSYDLLRDKTLSPESSADFIRRLIEEIPRCEPSDPT
ncbi:hypothetical protein SSPS47_10235 [Streptomyces sp. S4.7]|uniref:helix-turn-helix domain-containing protein n=1 Tax=Streptomyces sp. S4.7 TaxID=2705439 RepID=UPI0013991D76|nr:helix-turn-helix transcriptional regulator [Streptomyces sp. S4.7]QHY95495.1 hypothetical protein SSPS47_10235 [Streptomyces sp. S4.7]